MNNLPEETTSSTFVPSVELMTQLRQWREDIDNLDSLTSMRSFDIKSFGLCFHVTNGYRDNRWLANELSELIQRDGLDAVYPFVSSFSYIAIERDSERAHLNPARIAWVDSILKEFAHVA